MASEARPIVDTLPRVRAQVTTRDVQMQLGSYSIKDVLGEGATGIVYRAVDPQGRPVALKVLRQELALSDRERARFVDEAERLRRVRHRALVEVLDAGVFPNGLPFIAMPFLQGSSLAERLQQGPMRFDTALHLFEQLAEALQTLHRAGLVHRDIKPENIFVTQGDGQALLLDLGIARDVSSGPSTTTHAGLIRGTPAYMAPERFFGAPATPSTDIYELGVVLYLTLVGALPWMRFDDPTERMRPAPPSARGVVLPPRLSSTLMRALAVTPGERPQSAQDFASAVIEALSPESAAQIANQVTSYAQVHPLPPGTTPQNAAYAHRHDSHVTPIAQPHPYLPQSSHQPHPHSGMFAPTAMAPSVPPFGAQEQARAQANAYAPTAMVSSQQMQPLQSHSQVQTYGSQQQQQAPKRKTPTLFIAAMTGASLMGSGALALVLFLRGSPSSDAPTAEPITLSVNDQPPAVVATTQPPPPKPGQPFAQADDVVERRPRDGKDMGGARSSPIVLATKAAAVDAGAQKHADNTVINPNGAPRAEPSAKLPGAPIGGGIVPTAPVATASASTQAPRPLLVPVAFPASQQLTNCRSLNMFLCSPGYVERNGRSDCSVNQSSFVRTLALPVEKRQAEDEVCRRQLETLAERNRR